MGKAKVAAYFERQAVKEAKTGQGEKKGSCNSWRESQRSDDYKPTLPVVCANVSLANELNGWVVFIMTLIMSPVRSVISMSFKKSTMR